MTLKDKVFSGTIWMAGVSAAQQVLQFVVQIVLARLLVPHDYGVAALVMTIGSFVTILSSAGISAAIVQRKELPDGVLDAAAVITGGVALMLGGALFLTSGVFAHFYKVPEMTLLLRFVALDIFLKVMLSLYDALMLRRLQYRSLALRSLAGLVVQASASIALAYFGFGPTALVVGYVSGSATQLVLCIAATRYIPRTLGDFREVKGVFQFGAWVLLGRIANQLAITFDQMIVAKVLNVLSLGLYNVARSLTNIAPSFFLNLVNRVTLPVFSRHQDDLKWIEENYWRGLRLNCMICFPLCALIAIFSEPILALLYGSKWLAAAPLMRICTISIALQAVDAGYSGTVYAARGKPKYSLILLGFSLPVLPLCAWIGSFGGVIGYCWMMAAACTSFLAVSLLVLRHYFAFRIVRSIPLLLRAVANLVPMAAAGVALVRFGAVSFDTPPAVMSAGWFLLAIRAAASALVCLAIYALTIRFTMKDDFFFLYNGILKRNRNS